MLLAWRLKNKRGSVTLGVDFKHNMGESNYVQNVSLFINRALFTVHFFFFAPMCGNMGALVDGFNPLALQCTHSGRTCANFRNISDKSASEAPDVLPQWKQISGK